MESIVTPRPEDRNFKDVDMMQAAYSDGIQEALYAVVAKLENAKEKGYGLPTVIEAVKADFHLWESGVLDDAQLLSSLERN